MPTSAPRARPTDEQLKITGRIWTRALARQAQALLWMGAGYPMEEIERFAAIPWEELGRQTQEDIARELALLIELHRRESRG